MYIDGTLLMGESPKHPEALIYTPRLVMTVIQAQLYDAKSAEHDGLARDWRVVETVVFVPSILAKQSRQGKPNWVLLCQLSWWQTAWSCWDLKIVSKGDSFVKKGIYKTVWLLFISQTSSTLHYCLLVERGSQIVRFWYNIFTVHSTRSASSTAAADSRVMYYQWYPDWSSESVFRKFYYKPTHNPSYGVLVRPNLLASSELAFTIVSYCSTMCMHVLMCISTSPVQYDFELCETEPSEI